VKRTAPGSRPTHTDPCHPPMVQARHPLLFSARAFLAGCLLALPALAAVRPQGDTDTVYLRDGASEMGTVAEEGFVGVTLQPEKGAKKVLPWASVQSIVYSDAPEELGTGLATLGAGNFESAREQFQTLIAGADTLRPVLVQQGMFNLAFIDQRLGNVTEAIQGYDALLEKFPKGRFLRMAGENLVELHLLTGNAENARAALAKLQAGAKDVPGFDVEFGILEARLLAGEKKFAEAGARYAAVEAIAGAPAGSVQEAKLGRARMLLADGKAIEAEPMFRALIAESTVARVQSGAWNGLGEIQSAEGRTKREADRILEGLYSYLRTVVQYKPLIGESTEEYERALSGASTCFQNLSDLEQNPERKKLLRDRSRERNEQLQREYPNSIFLKKT
jgi:tetratricopeptide (TPR) repeat protein